MIAVISIYAKGTVAKRMEILPTLSTAVPYLNHLFMSILVTHDSFRRQRSRTLSRRSRMQLHPKYPHDLHDRHSHH